MIRLLIAFALGATATLIGTTATLSSAVEQPTVSIQSTITPTPAATVEPAVIEEPQPLPAPPATCPPGTTPNEVVNGVHISCLPDYCWNITVSDATPECRYGVKP